MSRRQSLTQQRSASAKEPDVAKEPRVRKVSKNSRNGGQLIIPPMSQKFTDCIQAGMSANLLERGADESLLFQGSVAGQLTQQIYEVIRSDNLSIENLNRCHKWKGESTSEIEYYYLRSRYFVSETDKMVRDRKKEDRVVCEPASMFHLVICSHLQNEHVTSYKIHRNLAEKYSNITRDYIVTALSYCSKCNPSLKAKPFQKKRHKNVYWELLPFERVHIELFEPFEGEKIQGRFSHLLYCRDYFSRYVWILPLQNGKRKHTVRTLTTFLLSLPRIPIFLESTTIGRDRLFDLCGQIVEQYSLKLGLGVKNSQRFHNNGIKDIKELLRAHRDECLQDWNLCLKYGPFHINQNISMSSDGRPSDLLFTSIQDCNRKFTKKRNEIIFDTPPQYIVHIGEGVLFLEDNNDECKVNDVPKDCGNLKNNDKQEQIDEIRDIDTSNSKNETSGQEKDDKRQNCLEISNIISMPKVIVRDDYIYDSDELANYDLETEQSRCSQIRMREFKADTDGKSAMGTEKRRKTLDRTLRSSRVMAVDESTEL